MRSLLPNFDDTATGYVWLDKLTAPFWRWMLRRAERQFTEDMGFPPEKIFHGSELSNSGFESDLGLAPWSSSESPEIPKLVIPELTDEFPFYELVEPEDTNRPPDRRP